MFFSIAKINKIITNLIKFLITYLVIFLQIYMPVAYAVQEPSIGKIEPVPGSASMDAAINNVPIVQIVAPNSSGVSHNRFNDFNVNKSGVILNNSTDPFAKSQLGGIILGNPNFTGGNSAKLIINEVVGMNKSLLNGATEIHGSPADYILANPNGIVVNGASFINTPRVTLSTGDLNFNNFGGLGSISVEQGKIIIGSGGIDVSGLDYFDIISRAVKFNGVIYGTSANEKHADVGIYAGRNDFNYATRKINKKQNLEDGKPVWGIDSSHLGGLYAGKITLVANENGVGVRAPTNMAASVIAV